MVDTSLTVFEDYKIRRHYDEVENRWYFSIQDIVGVLTESTDTKQYIKKMRNRDPELNSNWGTNCTLVDY